VRMLSAPGRLGSRCIVCIFMLLIIFNVFGFRAPTLSEREGGLPIHLSHLEPLPPRGDTHSNAGLLSTVEQHSKVRVLFFLFHYHPC
jgi:hypothetical protein